MSGTIISVSGTIISVSGTIISVSGTRNVEFFKLKSNDLQFFKKNNLILSQKRE